MLQIGDKMPFFEVVDQDGNKVASIDLIGKKTIIYFNDATGTPNPTISRKYNRRRHAHPLTKILFDLNNPL